MPVLDYAQSLQLLWLSLAAALLAAVALTLEFAVRRPLTQAFLLCGGLLLILAGLAGWLLDRPESAGALVLAVPCLVAWGGRSDSVKKLLAPVLKPWAGWSALLIVSILASRGLIGGLQVTDKLPLQDMGSLQKKGEVPGVAAVTDAGQRLPVFRYADTLSVDKAEATTLADERFTHKVVRLHGPCGDSNCHGLLFTGGRYAIQGVHVPTILADNGYASVAEPAGGDLVIYRGAMGDVTHTGVVRLIDRERDLVLVESKWGPLGTYLHPADAQPFGAKFSYYRSARNGHQLVLEVAPAESDHPTARHDGADSSNASLAVRRRAVSPWQRSLSRSRRPRA